MRYSSSGHDQITKHTQTNTHPALVHIFHFNNIGSFHGLANDIPKILCYILMVMRYH